MQESFVDKALTYFSQMRKHGAKPNLATFAYMVSPFTSIFHKILLIIRILDPRIVGQFQTSIGERVVHARQITV